MSLLKWILLGVGTLSLVALGWVGSILLDLDEEIRKGLERKQFVPPVEFFASFYRFQTGDTTDLGAVKGELERLGFREKKEGPIRSGQYQHATCEDEEHPQVYCFDFYTDQPIRIVYNPDRKIVRIYESGQPIESAEIPPRLFAQYYGNKPVFRDVIALGEIPTACLNATLAIEDPKFLEHPGISIRGIARAFLTNIRAGRIVEGASTITMQLVKNYYLTSHRTFSRKIREALMAPLLEYRADKDQILQLYLNVIYMGQSGPFQIRGFAAASRHYFNKEIGQLEVNECALLAAILNSPGRFNPFKHPERATKRRNRVLAKMVQHKYIGEVEKESASQKPIPSSEAQKKSTLAPYFVDAVRAELAELNVENKAGLRVYTTLDPVTQNKARQSLRDSLKEVRKKLADDKKNKLEYALLSTENASGEIRALIGGSDFRKAPFNRAIRAHRQVGSVIKPVVYLAALESRQKNGDFFGPLTPIFDEKFVHKYEGQSWEPRNYSGKTFGRIPLFYALKSSLNISTAKLGLEIGLEAMIDVARRLGINSKLQALPALSLGAFELYPIEVLQMYSTFANYGVRKKLHTIRRVTDLDDQNLYSHRMLAQRVIDEPTAAVLVSMLEQVPRSGTARSLQLWRNFKVPSAGKTGTTSNNKDAWYAGFTPRTTTVVWAGLDDNTSHGLTGSSGALPLWAGFMKSIYENRSGTPFQTPEGTAEETIDLGELQEEPVLLRFRSQDTETSWTAAD